MRRVVLPVVLVAALAGVALGADSDARRVALEKAQALVDQALAALRADRGDDAAELLSRARSAAPGEPVVLFDHGVALEAAGKIEEARDAYRQAVRQGESAIDDVAVRARHNLALSHLLAARDVEALLRAPGALEDAVRASGAPGGEPLTPDTVTMLASQLRSKAIDDGLKNARSAIETLRDTVRTNPADADAVRNLVLAQRVRRFLEEERRRQQEQDAQRNDSGEDEQGDESQDEQQPSAGDDGGSEEGGEQPQEQPSGGDEEEQPGEQQPGDEGESTDDGQSSDTREGEPRDLGREEAERMLEQLLDAANLKARQVERMRAERLRRGAVEKDW